MTDEQDRGEPTPAPADDEFRPIRTADDLKPIQPEPKREYRHIDDIAADHLNVAMREKLAKKRALGWGGWDNPDICSASYLSRLIVSHVAKGDPVDVANLCAFLHYRGERIDVEGSYKLLLEVFRVASELAATLAHTSERQEKLDELRNLVTGR